MVCVCVCVLVRVDLQAYSLRNVTRRNRVSVALGHIIRATYRRVQYRLIQCTIIKIHDLSS